MKKASFVATLVILCSLYLTLAHGSATNAESQGDVVLVGSSASDTLIQAGQTATVSMQFQGIESPEPVLVNLALFSGDGTEVSQAYSDNVSFSPQEIKTFRLVTPASLRPGVYTFKAGVFTAGGGSLLHWYGNVSQLIINASDPVNNAGLVGYWKFDEGAGTSVADSSGLGNSGIMSSRGVAWTVGKNGGALSFDGNRSSVYIGNPSNLQTASGTISLWIKTADAGSGSRTIIGKRDAYTLYLQDNVLKVYDWMSFSEKSIGVNLADDQWHNIVLTYQGAVPDGSAVYVDGVKKLTGTMGILGQEAPLMIGNQAGSIQNFKGLLDDVRVYNRVLSESEIQALAGNVTPPRPPLLVSCNANTQSAKTGDTVTWTAQILNANGTPTYSWKGTDGLSGLTQIAKKIYTTAGSKSAIVTVTAGDQTVSTACFTTITDALSQKGTLTVVTNVVNTGGGTAVPSDFIAHIVGTNPSVNTFAGSATGTTILLDSGTYSVTEDPKGDYKESFSSGCTDTMTAGGNKTCTITNTYSGSVPPASNGLVGYWKFDETSGTTAVDSSGAGNTGTLALDGLGWTSGKFANALSFTGAGYVDVENDQSLQNASGTISAWIKTPDAGSGARVIVGKLDAFSLYLQNNNLEVYDWGSFTERPTGINLADDTWHHIVMTYQSGVPNGTILYVDGVQRVATTTTIGDQSMNLFIGNQAKTAQFFSGLIDDVRVYNKALSPDEAGTLN